MRRQYDEFTKKGADVTAIGTGGRRMARAFIEDEQVPFRVLLDHDGAAARVIGAGTFSASTVANFAAWKSAVGAFTKGHRQHQTGPRPFQLGGTLIIAPGDELRYIDLEEYAGDHADLDEMLAVL